MENKEYLNKVLDHLVRGTKIDYENNIISSFFPSLSLSLYIYSSTCFLPFSFSSYCKNTFGLTDEEIEYVWNEFKEIILGKINQ